MKGKEQRLCDSYLFLKNQKEERKGNTTVTIKFERNHEGKKIYYDNYLSLKELKGRKKRQYYDNSIVKGTEREKEETIL